MTPYHDFKVTIYSASNALKVVQGPRFTDSGRVIGCVCVCDLSNGAIFSDLEVNPDFKGTPLFDIKCLRNDMG